MAGWRQQELIARGNIFGFRVLILKQHRPDEDGRGPFSQVPCMLQQTFRAICRKVLVNQEKRRMVTLKELKGTGGVGGFPNLMSHVAQVVGQQSAAGRIGIGQQHTGPSPLLRNGRWKGHFWLQHGVRLGGGPPSDLTRCGRDSMVRLCPIVPPFIGHPITARWLDQRQ